MLTFMNLYVVCVCLLFARVEEGIGDPGTEVTGCYEVLCGCCQLNPGPPRE